MARARRRAARRRRHPRDVGHNSLGDLIEPTLQALSGLDVLVVAALGRSTDGLGVAVPSNARVEEYIPFDELLPRASVFITNGGLGGTQRALASGIPVVTAGVTEDKALVAARVAGNGLGADLATNTPTIEAIREAFVTVLGDAACRERCTQIATESGGLGPSPVHHGGRNAL